jgi:nucleotide-binding universal stress UspA family protein
MKRAGRPTARSKAGAEGGILCGTDFSDRAREAADAAAAIAKQMGERLFLVHAVELPHLGGTRAAALKWLTTSRKRDLRRAAADLRKTGIRVEERVEVGAPDEVLVHLARTLSSRLVVVSSLGRRGAERWLLGSVSERTAQQAVAPTLVVREPGPLIHWAAGKRPLKIFVCFNCTETSDAALRWVKDLSRIGRCDLVIGFLDWPPEEWARLGAGGALPFGGNPPEVQAALERDVRARATEALGEMPFRLRVEANWGRPDARLGEMASEEGADLIVVGSHQYQGFERVWHASISRGLLHAASMSVAVVPLASHGPRLPHIAPPVRRVLAATDFSATGDAVIPQAYSILRGGGTLHLLHVTSRKRGMSDPLNPPGAKESGQVADCVAKLRKLIPSEAAALGILTDVVIIEGEHVAEEICQAGERLGVDVICLGQQGRSAFSRAILGSVAEKVMAISRRPLLLVRPQPR